MNDGRDLHVAQCSAALTDPAADDSAAPLASTSPDEALTANTVFPRELRRPDTSRRRPRHRRRRWLPGSDQLARLRLLGLSALGVGCLLAAEWLQPDYLLLFALPEDPAGLAALVCGITGAWLVPGLWLSALIVRTGAGLPAWLGTRIATTLIWYALVGPVIHQSADSARVTAGGILIATVAATAAVSVGTALSLSRWPARLWLRLLIAVLVGLVGAQVAIWVSMHVWTHDVNYSEIQRLDWFIAAGCAVLVAVGALSRPKLPAATTARKLVRISAAMAVIAATAGTVSLTSAIWSPALQMESVFSIEQIPAPPGADVAFALHAMGPEGAHLFEVADFTVTDDTGHPVPASTRIETADSGANQAILLVVLEPDSRSLLCRSIQAPKLTVRDQASGVLVQAVVPDDWCAR